MTVTWEQIGLAPGMEAKIRNLWTKSDYATNDKGLFTTLVDPHDVVMLRVQP